MMSNSKLIMTIKNVLGPGYLKACLLKRLWSSYLLAFYISYVAIEVIINEHVPFASYDDT